MEPLDTILARYDYVLEPGDIADTPASPRDSAKLLVYNRADGSITVDAFSRLDQYLPSKALIIFNDTKVIPARLPVHIPTGGVVDILCIRFDAATRMIECLSPRTLAIGTLLTVGPGHLTVEAKDGSVYRMRLHDNVSFAHLLTRYGETPIPPYLKNTPLTESDLREKYQTVFAKHAGSSAAPTASLHFTKRLLAKLKRSGFDTAYVTLHVGLGTFAPLTEENIAKGTLHHETYSIPRGTLQKIAAAQKAGRPIIAVGTTAARALESAFSSTTTTDADERNPADVFSGVSQAVGPRVSAGPAGPDSDRKKRPRDSGVSTITNLFIREGYQWRIVDGLITNFHVPRSSLLMLVATLVGREKLFELYAFARRHGFRFLSFGDGMLIR